MTARELLSDALARARTCSPALRACARLHAARVMARFDETEARKLLKQALGELDQLPFTPQDRRGIERETYMLTGAVAPDLAKERHIRGNSVSNHDEQTYGPL